MSSDKLTKEEKKALKEQKKLRKKSIKEVTGQLKGTSYYKDLLKKDSLYKKMNISFSLMNILTVLVVAILVFALSSIFLSTMTRNSLKHYVEDASGYIKNQKTNQTCEILLTQLVEPSMYETMDVSVKLTLGDDSSSNNPYFDRILSDSVNHRRFEKLSSDKVVIASFKYMSNRYIYTSVDIFVNGQTYTLSAFKNVQINFTYCVFLILTLVIILVIANVVAILSNRAISLKVLLPLRKVADQVKDVTEKDLETDLAPFEMTQTNVDSVDNLVTALNAMIERLQTAFTEQSNFVSNVSHELRIPLTIMKGYIDILQGWGRGDVTMEDEAIKAISDEIDNMRGIVERLLLIQSIESKNYSIDLKKVDLNELAVQFASTAKVMTQDHNISFEQIEKPASCLCDMVLLEDTVRIILENAIKYTPKGGNITLKVRSNSKASSLIISDTGIGIPKDECSRVKERFYRTDLSRDKRIGGTGLGLSIADSSVKLMGGTLTIVSDTGKGTNVIITLPKDK